MYIDWWKSQITRGRSCVQLCVHLEISVYFKKSCIDNSHTRSKWCHSRVFVVFNRLALIFQFSTCSDTPFCWNSTCCLLLLILKHKKLKYFKPTDRSSSKQCSKRWCLCLTWPLQAVWLDLAKFRHFGKSLPIFGKFLTVYFLFGKMLSLLWQTCDIIGEIFVAANGQMLKYNLIIWSYWLQYAFLLPT